MNSENFDTLDNMSTSGGQSQMLSGRYKILRKLGEGGMGMVYLAEDTELGNEKVAVKFIPPVLAGNERALKNLKAEAQTARRLTHPNIVRLHDLHTDGHQKFLVMEYIDGKTLDEILAGRNDEKFTIEEILPVAAQIASALDYAHCQGVLHRDIKPSNIMLTGDGTARLLDFGIARQLKDSLTQVTGQSQTSGTLPYMSPQQLLGEKPEKSMDIYSFAAVLYECLSGRPPFYTGEIAEQIKSKTPEPISGLADAINATFLCGLAKQSALRPQSAAEFVSMLGGKATSYDPAKDTLDYAKTMTFTPRPEKSRKKTFVLIAAIILLVFCVGLAFTGIMGFVFFPKATADPAYASDNRPSEPIIPDKDLPRKDDPAIRSNSTPANNSSLIAGQNNNTSVPSKTVIKEDASKVSSGQTSPQSQPQQPQTLLYDMKFAEFDYAETTILLNGPDAQSNALVSSKLSEAVNTSGSDISFVNAPALLLNQQVLHDLFAAAKNKKGKRIIVCTLDVADQGTRDVWGQQLAYYSASISAQLYNVSDGKLVSSSDKNSARGSMFAGTAKQNAITETAQKISVDISGWLK